MESGRKECKTKERQENKKNVRKTDRQKKERKRTPLRSGVSE